MFLKESGSITLHSLGLIPSTIKIKINKLSGKYITTNSDNTREGENPGISEAKWEGTVISLEALEALVPMRHLD